MAFVIKNAVISNFYNLTRGAFAAFNEKSRSLVITTVRCGTTKDVRPGEHIDTKEHDFREWKGKPDYDSEKKLISQIKRLDKKIRTLTNDKVELQNKYKRLLVDRENVRARLSKQVEQAKMFGIQRFCKDLIEVADILDTATKTVPLKEANASNPHLKNLYEGLSMTTTSLKQMFLRYQLETINPLNVKFDPNFHEALSHQEMKDVAPGMVVTVYKIGYSLHGRCLRPALVRVSKSS